MFVARDVTVRFGGLAAVDGIDLDVPDRGIFALVGPNGAGKTTLINAFSRIAPVERGSIALGDVDVLRLAPHEVIRSGIGRSFQKAEIFSSLSVLDNVLVGYHVRTRAGLEAAFMPARVRAEEAGAREYVHRVLDELDLWEFRDAAPVDLPYGIQKLIDVARALVSEPRLLLLDEPFAGLTAAEVPHLVACIRRAAEHCAVLMIEHHFELLLEIAQRITVMNFGRKIAEGPPADVRADPEVIRCFLGTGRGSAGPA